ncbi:MAG: protein kinase domain-containing protein [Planctomycetaceae bacterium]
MTAEYHREYLLRLPLPLAQLYARAFNAKDARGRHDNSFYVFEAFLKLAASVAVAHYVRGIQRGAAHDAAVDRELRVLSCPSMGQWLAILRRLAGYFSRNSDGVEHPLSDWWPSLALGRKDLPELLALYRRIKNGPDGQPVGDTTVSLLGLFDALVLYRNTVFGHGAARHVLFYEQQMGPLLFPAVNDLLREEVFNVLGSRGCRLVVITQLELASGGEQVEMRFVELTGMQGERIAPVMLPLEVAKSLSPNRLAVLPPDETEPLRVDPLLVYRESELCEQVLFLNKDRDGKQVEYLSYYTGATERDSQMTQALASLLSLITGKKVDEAELGQMADNSRSTVPAGEQPVPVSAAEAGVAPRRIGDHDVLAELGRGGMGVVYLARQRSLGRLVALKMLPPELAGHDANLGRFRREMRALARCDHPHIVKLLSTGELPGRRLYYTMEWVPGSDLESVWRELSGDSHAAMQATALGGSTWANAVRSAAEKQRLKASNPLDDRSVNDTSPLPLASDLLPPLPELPRFEDDPGSYIRRVATLIRDAALAVQAVHDQDLIHRDIKPSNLMITADGQRVVLMDFGLAKGQALTSFTKSGGFQGTLRYAAPEQLATSKILVGASADVRGLGVTLWELLTRRRLFAEATDEARLAQAVLTEDVPRLRQMDSSFDQDLEAIVLRATERRLDSRIPSAGKLAEYLSLYLDHQPLPIRPPSGTELFLRWMSENRLMATVLSVSIATVVLVAAGAFGWILKERDDAVRATKDKTLALEQKQDALTNEQQAKQAAQARSLELARQQIQRNVRTALKHVCDGEESSSLIWLADALRVAEDALKSAREDSGTSPTVLKTLEVEHDLARRRMEMAARQFPLQQMWINARVAAFDHSGELLATGDDNGLLAVYRVGTGEELARYQLPAIVRDVQFHRDGRQLMAVAGTMAVLWNWNTPNEAPKAFDHTNVVVRHAKLLGNDEITTAGDDGEIRVWNHRGAVRQVRSFDAGRSLVYSEDGGRLLVDNRSKSPSYPEYFEIFPEAPIAAPAAAVEPKALNVPPAADERLVASDGCEADQSSSSQRLSPTSAPAGSSPKFGLVVWDIQRGKTIGDVIDVGDRSVRAVLSPNAELVAVASVTSFDPGGQFAARSHVDVWRIADGEKLATGETNEQLATTIKFSPNGKLLAIGFGNGRIGLVRIAPPVAVERGWMQRILSKGKSSRATLDSTQVELHDQFLKFGFLRHNAYLRFDGQDGASPAPVALAAPALDPAPAVPTDLLTGEHFPPSDVAIHQHRLPVRDVCFSPDGLRFAAAFCSTTVDFQSTDPGEIQVWNLETGLPITSPLPHAQPVSRGVHSRVTFSPDGTTALICGNEARLWSLLPRRGGVAQLAGNPQERVGIASGGQQVLGTLADRQQVSIHAWAPHTGDSHPLPAATSIFRRLKTFRTVLEQRQQGFDGVRADGSHDQRFDVISVSIPVEEELEFPVIQNGREETLVSFQANLLDELQLQPSSPGAAATQRRQFSGLQVAYQHDDRRQVRFANIAEDKQLTWLTQFLPHGTLVTNATLDSRANLPNAKVSELFLMTTCLDGTVWIWRGDGEPIAWSQHHGRPLKSDDLATPAMPPSGDFLLTHDLSGYRVWNLAPSSNRKAKDWRRWVEAVALRKIDATQQVSKLSLETAVHSWEQDVLTQVSTEQQTHEWHLGKVSYLNRCGPGEAIASHLRSILKTTPDDVQASSNLGAILLSLGQTTESREVLQEALRRTPKNLELQYGLARAYLIKPRPDLARYQQVCRQAVADHLASSEPDVLPSLSFLCVLGPDALSDWEPILRAAKSAAEKQPEIEEDRINYGGLLYRAGRLPLAATQLKQALAIRLQRSQSLPPFWRDDEEFMKFYERPETAELAKRDRPQLNGLEDGLLILAMIEHRLGHKDRKELIDNLRISAREQAQQEYFITENLDLGILFAEAEATLGAEPEKRPGNFDAAPAPAPAPLFEEAAPAPAPAAF